MNDLFKDTNIKIDVVLADDKGQTTKFECGWKLQDEFKEEDRWSLRQVKDKHNTYTCGKQETEDKIAYKCVCTEQKDCFKKTDIAKDLYGDGNLGELSSTFSIKEGLHQLSCNSLNHVCFILTNMQPKIPSVI